jgi:hypothetical protein
MNEHHSSQDTETPGAEVNSSWRIKLGFVILIASISWPVLIPVLPFLGVSGGAIATFSGVMIVVAELMMLTGAAIAGKEGFTFIKQKVFGFFAPFAPPKKVGRTRYTIGLVMFVIPLLFGWASPYFGHRIPGFQQYTIAYAIGGDALLLASLFVLGGDFWDKLRSLFLRNATAQIPKSSA